MRAHVAPFYSPIGRPSIDPELLIRMLLVEYCCGIRSERRLCEDVHLNLAYREFCRLGARPLNLFRKPAWAFSRLRPARESFEVVVRRCVAESLVGSEGFAVDASLIKA